MKELDQATPRGIGNTFDLTQADDINAVIVHFCKVLGESMDAAGQCSIEYYGMGYIFDIGPK